MHVCLPYIWICVFQLEYDRLTLLSTVQWLLMARLHDTHRSPNAWLFAPWRRWISNAGCPLHLSVIDVSQASHWSPLINLCVRLLPRSIRLTNIITQQSIWHWDLLIRVYMKRPRHLSEIINTSYTQYRGLIYATPPRSLCPQTVTMILRDLMMSLWMTL